MVQAFLAALSCLPLCYPMGCSLPDSSVHGISQAKIHLWVAFSSCREASRFMDQTLFSCIGSQILHYWATWEALKIWYNLSVKSPGIGSFFGGDLYYEFSFLDSYKAIQFSISYCVSCNILGFWGIGSFYISLQINICIVVFSIILFSF